MAKLNPLTLRIYSKPGCHLCDVAKEVLVRFGRRYPLRIIEINIAEDPVLFERYREEIPVIFVEGQKLFKYSIDEDKLRAAIEARLKHKDTKRT